MQCWCVVGSLTQQRSELIWRMRRQDEAKACRAYNLVCKCGMGNLQRDKDFQVDSEGSTSLP